MKQYFLKGIAVAGFAFLTVPSFAQNKNEKKEKDVQTIVITRTGDLADKTVIEINGDKITVDGKDVKDLKDVNVNVNKFKGGDHLMHLRVPNAGNFNFNWDDEKISLFTEDSNRAMLGIITDMDEKGAEIVSVSKGSAAEKAGLKKGDIITKIDDRKIEDAEDVSEAVRSHKPGDKVVVELLRDGKEQKITAELDKWKGVKMGAVSIPRIMAPSTWDAMPTPPNAPDARFYFNTNRGKLGLSVQDTEDGKGVKVLDADEEGNAAKAGVKEDDIITHVNDKAVNSASEIASIMRENRDKTAVRLQLLRNGKKQTIEVKMPRKLKTADL